VRVAGERCREPRRLFPSDSMIELDPRSGLLAERSAAVLSGPSAGAAPGGAGVPPLPFVSRGGDKLDSVLEAWRVPVSGRVWLDAGCSTGGFTHCLLLRGARLVHAVDVGYNQLDWRLRNHPAVAVHERTNIMGLDFLEPQPEAAVADLSFRSMEGAAGRILELVSDNELYALVKPQFERKYFIAGKDDDGDGTAGAAGPAESESFTGVVAAGETQAILEDLAVRLAAEGIALERLAPAGLKGRSGNQEYIALLRRSEEAEAELIARARQAIAALFA
jgi:23S rRNA (cytidine1920-2'-O)/16S rRNA (cytidine1409-2'-O)-methyltransferase